MVKIKYNLTENSIDISFPYNPNDSTILDLVKLLPDRQFMNEGGRKFWRVPVQAGVRLAESIFEFCEDCQAHNEAIEVDREIIEHAIKVMDHWKIDNYILSSRSTYPLENKELDEMFKGILKPSQKTAAIYMHRNARGVINGNPDASRKIETLAVMELAHDQPALILCPHDEKFIWGSRVKMLTGHNVLILGEDRALVAEARGELEKAPVVICNFGNMKDYQWLHTIPWRALVIDSSHHIKSSTSEQAKIIIELVKALNVPHRYLLSDTDYVSKPFEIMIQLEIAGRLNEIFGGHKKFLARYQSYTETPGGWKMGEAANVAELDRLLRENCYVKNNEVNNE